jgi:hypothetical protein
MSRKLFNISKGTIQRRDTASIRHPATLWVNVGPLILSQEEHDDLANHIIDADTSTRAWTMRDVINHITERYGKTMDVNSTRHMLDRDPRIKSCRGVPMEERRLQVRAEDITADYEHLAEARKK